MSALKKHDIYNPEGKLVDTVSLKADSRWDPLQAYAQKTTMSYKEVVEKGFTTKKRSMIEAGKELDLSPVMMALVARGEIVETLYQKLEEVTKPPKFPQDWLDRMNLCLGFPVGTKGQDYRPYCCRANCEHGPRMMKTPFGFECWDCHGKWDLRLTCKHESPRGDGSMCKSEELEKMPVGYRCRRCAGMHHLTGRIKDEESIETCKLGCCGEPH